MRPILVPILSWLVLSTVIATVGRATEVTALKILHKRYEPESGELNYELWNDSERTITAWRLSLARDDGHGHAASSVLDQDLIDRGDAPAVAGSIGILAPGARLTDRWRVAPVRDASGPMALSLGVVAVVFDDLTWQGEDAVAVSILASRAARARELARVIDLLQKEARRSRPRHLWTSELGRWADRLRQESRTPAVDEGSRPEIAAQLSAIRLELADRLEQVSREVTVAPNPTESLHALTQELESRYEAAMESIPDAALAATEEAEREGGER